MPPYQSYASEKFWESYDALPEDIRQLADKAYELFKDNPQHASLHFKKVGKRQPIYSVRITDNYRSLGYIKDNSVYWFWIGNHASYERMIKSI
jgi:hypothetical protein